MKQRVLILGAGFGGLELAARLQETLADSVDVTLIDKSNFFNFGFAKFEVLFGRKTADEIKSFYRDLAPKVTFKQEQIQSIHPDTRRVVTDSREYESDFLIVALGADMNPGATPGLAEGGYEFYTLPGVERLAKVLPSVQSGTIVISILGLPYKCPPAPFEAALQLHDYLTAKGIRDKITIRVLSPAPVPLPVSKEGSDTILRLFSERGDRFLPGHAVTSLDAAARTAAVKDKAAISFDLFMGVPAHRVPPVVASAGLAVDGWVPVNANNLETRFPNVFALGDVTKIPVGNAMVPKAGAFADRAARFVAEEIAYRISGEGTPARFDAAGACYLEFGGGTVAKIEANFLGGPAPDVRFMGPSTDFRPEKDHFASSRLERWFHKKT